MKLKTNKGALQSVSRCIVNDIARRVRPGEIVGLLGPRSSGKVALLQAIYQALQPSAQYLPLVGPASASVKPYAAAWRCDALAFSVREVIAVGCAAYKGSLEASPLYVAALVQGVLQRLQLLALAEQNFQTLAQAQQQRVLFAQALVQEPQFLLCDEAFQSLDAGYQREVLGMARALGITTFLAINDPTLAATYCTRLYLLGGGRIVAAGTPATVLTPTQIRQAYVDHRQNQPMAA